MDFNEYLLQSLLPYGRYDTHTVHRVKNRVRLNYICAFISFFCGVKSLIITLTPWDTGVEPVFYLIDLYIVNHDLQRIFFQCLSNVHFALGFVYLFYGYLNMDPRRMRCLDMFFMPDLNELCKHYGLKRKSAARFVWKAKLYKQLMYPMIYSFWVTFGLFIIRCLFLSYLKVEFWIFLVLCLPMAVITYFSFHCLVIATLSAYLLALLTMDFLILRLSTISDGIMKKLKPENISLLKRSDRLVFLKDRPDMARIIQRINEVVVQFKVGSG